MIKTKCLLYEPIEQVLYVSRCQDELIFRSLEWLHGETIYQLTYIKRSDTIFLFVETFI